METVTNDDEPVPDVETRLHLRGNNRADIIDTFKGIRLAPGLGLPLLRICAVRGILHTPGFAEELYGLDPLFSRAINARRIMSDIVPDMRTDDEMPYCIWFPDVAKEDTYRQLAGRYPSMAYQVGRACAVAGYDQLFLELDLLPDTHIAEEARAAGSTAIFESIMAHPVLFSVMDDYNRSVSPETAEPARLNADTALRSSLLIRQCFYEPDLVTEAEWDCETLPTSDGFDRHLFNFNITEDYNIDVESTDWSDLPRDETWIDLLSSPLPLDLPLVDKDNLIRMAAYNGDIDRYVRLRRPQHIAGELDCCVHGIYHNTGFAVWWRKQEYQRKLYPAIAARYIMNNILIDDMLDDTPYLIWYPTIAKETTYRELARRRPWLLIPVLRACIVAGYEKTFEELVVGLRIVDQAIYNEAERSVNPMYKQRLDDILAGEQPEELLYYSQWKREDTMSCQKSRNLLIGGLTGFLPVSGGWPTLYNGACFDTSELELYMCLPGSWLAIWREEEDDLNEWRVDYSSDKYA